MPDMPVPLHPNRVELPPLSNCSPALVTALETPTVAVVTDEGFTVRTGIWTCPPCSPEAIRQEANSRAGVLAVALATPPVARIPVAWLLKLAALVAGSKPLSEIEAQARAYAEMLDYPAFVYSRDTLREAGGQRFRFFPALAELRAFFDEKVSAVREEERRCHLIAQADGQRQPVDDWRPPTDAEKAGVARLLSEAFGGSWQARQRR